MNENKNIEKGENSLEGKHIIQPSQLQTDISNALAVDIQINQTMLAELEASTNAIEGQTQQQAASTTNTVSAITQTLDELINLQEAIRNDKTRSESEKIFILSEKTKPFYETIDRAFSKLMNESTARYENAKRNLFTATAGNLSPVETSLISVMAAALNRVDSTILTSTESETKVSLYLLSNFPGLISNKLIDPMQDAGHIARDADEKFSKVAYDMVNNSIDIKQAVDAFGISIGRNRSQMLPGSVLTQLKNGRV